VEARAEGTPEALQAFVAWCRHGPPAARVDDVQVSAVPPTGLDRGFELGMTG